jgi:hypothetical protein
MEKRLAQIISIIFHPLLIPTYLFLILLNLPVYFAMIIPLNAKWMILGLIFLNTCILPSVFVFLIYKRGVVSSVYLETREERTFPYMVTVIFFYLAYYLLRRMQVSPILYYILAGMTLLMILSFVINLFWKISTHMTAAGAFLGTILGVSYFLEMYMLYLILALVILNGMVGFARLKEKAHSPAQVYAGFLLGSIIMSLLFLIQ